MLDHLPKSSDQNISLAAALKQSELDFSRPSGPQIFDVLRKAVIWGIIEPGRQLSEIEIGNLFGASRTPVREAIARLKNLGLIEVRPNRGTFVAKMDAQRIRQAQFLREAIELAVVSRLVETGLPDDHVAALSTNLADQRSASAAADQQAFLVLDDAFHHLLCAATGYAQTSVVLEQEKLHMDRLRRLSSYKDPDELGLLVTQHERIFQSILSGDGLQARTAMTHHLRRILTTLDHFANEQAGYFE